MERKPITDEMILEPFLRQLQKKFPVGEFIIGFMLVCWVLGIPVFIYLGGILLALWDCVWIAVVYFGLYRPKKKKRLSRLEEYRKTVCIQDFEICEDTCATKWTVNEVVGKSYYISFSKVSRCEVQVTQQQFAEIREGDPFYTAVIRPECLSKYGLKKPFPPLWWSGLYWYRPDMEQ